MHAFNGELFVQANWDTQFVAAVPTQFRDGRTRSASATRTIPATAGTAVPVQINDSGAALGYYVSEDGYPR